MTVMTLHQIFQLAQQLPRRQRRALITLLSNELQAESGMPTTDDAWARLDAFRAELTALGPTTPTLTDQLEADRQQRQTRLEGRSDVYH